MEEYYSKKEISELGKIILDFLEKEWIAYSNSFKEKGINPLIMHDYTNNLNFSIFLSRFLEKNIGEFDIFEVDSKFIFKIHFYFLLIERQIKTQFFNNAIFNIEKYRRSICLQIISNFTFDKEKHIRKNFENKSYGDIFNLFLKGKGLIKEDASKGINREVVTNQINSHERYYQLRNYVCHPESYIEYSNFLISEINTNKQFEKIIKVYGILCMNVKVMEDIFKKYFQIIKKENSINIKKEKFLRKIFYFSLSEISEICTSKNIDCRTTKQKNIT